MYDSDGDGIPDGVLIDPNNSVLQQIWEGGNFLIDGAWSYVPPQNYYGPSSDIDHDGIPDLFDPYSTDPWNNTTFYFAGGGFVINGAHMDIEAGYYGGLGEDGDGDDIPDGCDPYPLDRTNNSTSWTGGVFLIDYALVPFAPGYYATNFGDTDGDGIPNTHDPYPSDFHSNTDPNFTPDPSDENFYIWPGPGQQATFTIENEEFTFIASPYLFPWADTDTDLIPDVIDPFPTDCTNNHDSDMDGVPDWVPLAYGFEIATFDPDQPRQLNGLTDGLTWRQAYENLVLSYLVNPTQDSDGDGMPDLYEIIHGLSRINRSDAADAPAGDYVFNFEKQDANLAPADVVSAADYLAFTGHDRAAVIAHHDPNRSVRENDWDGDLVSNVDELLTFATDPRNAASVPTEAEILTVMEDGRGSFTTRINFAHLLIPPPPNNPPPNDPPPNDPPPGGDPPPPVCECPAVGNGCNCTAENLCSSLENANTFCPRCWCGGNSCGCISQTTANFCGGATNPIPFQCEIYFPDCTCGGPGCDPVMCGCGGFDPTSCPADPYDPETIGIVPDFGMVGSLGDQIPSKNPGSTQKHFVTPKRTSELPQEYVVLRAFGVTREQMTPGPNQEYFWDGGVEFNGSLVISV